MRLWVGEASPPGCCPLPTHLWQIGHHPVPAHRGQHVHGAPRPEGWDGRDGAGLREPLGLQRWGGMGGVVLWLCPRS